MLPPFSDSKFISFTIVKIQMAIRFKIDLKNPPSTYLPTYLLLYISIFMTLCKMALTMSNISTNCATTSLEDDY